MASFCRKSRPGCWIGPCVLAAFWLVPLSATAHGIHVSARVEGHMIRGKAYYHGDSPVRDAKIRALDPSDDEIATTQTDAEGEFSLKAQFRCDHRLLVEVGDGHGAEFLIKASQLPGDLPARGDKPVSAASSEVSLETIRNELSELRNQLQRHEERIRIQDLLGGIGYIFGIAGVAYYFLGIRRKKAA